MSRFLLFLALSLPTSLLAVTFGPEHRVADTPRTSYPVEHWPGVVVPRGDGWVVFTYEEHYLPIRPPHLVATPVSRDGQPHPEQQVVIGENGVNLRAAATPRGFLVSYTVIGAAAEVLSLDGDLKPAAPPVALSGTEVDALVCNDTRCAAETSKGALRSLVLFDFDGRITSGPVALGSISGRGISLAANGNLFIAGWADAFVRDASLAFIDAEGRIIRSMVLPKELPVAEPVVAPHPAGALVVLGSTVAAIRMDGSIAGRATLPSPGELSSGVAAIGDNGSEYLLVIRSVYANGSSVLGAATPAHLYSVRLSHALDVLDTAARPLSLLHVTNQWPSIAANGTDFAVAWLHQGTSSQATRVVRVDAAGENGTLVDPVPAPQFAWSLAATAQATLAVWGTISSDGGAALHAARLDSGETLELSRSVGHAFSATDRRDFLVAWDEPDSVVIGWIPGAGEASVRKTSLAVDATVAGLAWDGSGYMLGLRAIGAPSDLLVRVASDGSVMWSRPISAGLVGLASIEGRTLVLGMRNSAIYGTDGSLLAEVPPFVVESQVASNGRDQFLVTTKRFERNATRLFATRIDGEGRLLDGSGIEFAKSTTSSVTAVPFGGRWLLAWRAPDPGVRTFPDLRDVTGELPSSIHAMASDGRGGAIVLVSRVAAEGRWVTPVIVTRTVVDETPSRRRTASR
jgi:hypothetical protein